MKKVLMLTFAMCVMFSMSALAQGSMGSDSSGAKKKSSAKSDAMAAGETSVNGTITTNKAGKVALKADSDGAVWTIENPEAVKGHEGHHVTVSGHPNAKKKTIHIMKVDMMADASKGDGMKGDSMKSDSKSKKKSSK
jgi:hypothetical protein